MVKVSDYLEDGILLFFFSGTYIVYHQDDVDFAVLTNNSQTLMLCKTKGLDACLVWFV